MIRKVRIVDTTLRDGEQTAGVVFANSEKLRIAKMLDALGIDEIEAGIPVMGGDEKKAIKDIVNAGLQARIMSWNRAIVDDIKHSLDCGVDAASISISTSDILIKYKLRSVQEKVIEAMCRACEFAKKHNLYVSINAEDASRTEPGFLLQFAKAAKNAGADRVRFSDTLGVMEPFITYERIKWLLEEVKIDIEVHMHNDFGMATANTLAGIKAGATYAGVTVVGLGERAGNAALEEVVMALKYLWGIDLNFRTEMFRKLAEYVSMAAKRKLPAWKAIVGSNIFTHESGIHADGTLKDARTYEIIPPEEVGLKREIIIGKHSGKAALQAKYAMLGIKLPEKDLTPLLEQVRALAVELKRHLFDEDLIYLYKDYMKEHSSI